MKNNNPMIIAAVAIVFGVTGFFGGMKYQQSKQPSNFSFGNGQINGERGFRNGMMNGQSGQNGNGMMRRAGGQVVGEITSVDKDSVTIKLQDGSSKIVLLSSSTSVNKAVSATAADLKSGEQVAVFGAANSDGSVTAGNIQLNPQFRGPGGATGSAGTK